MAEHSLRSVGIALCLLVAVALGVTALAQPPIANASHANNLHLRSIHLWGNDEDFCVNSTGTSQPGRWIDAYNNATAALWGNADAAQEWDAKAWDAGGAWWRVWFVGHGSNPCQNLPTAERGPIEIEYWIEDDTRSGPQPYLCSGSFDVSCAAADTPVLFEAGHWNYAFYYIFLYKPYAVGDASADGGANFAYHQINHETGHALGFADGAGAGDCPVDPPSVMHSIAYQCTVNLRYPSTRDTNAETNYALSH